MRAMSWVAIAAGVAFLIVALATAARLARAGAALQREREQTQPRLNAALAQLEETAARTRAAAATAGVTAESAAAAAQRLQTSVQRLRLVSEAGGEGLALLRGLRRWVAPR
jgi:hypothetical protein